MNLKYIYKDRPFGDTIDIAKIRPFKIGTSKEAYKIEDASGKLYKLRICASQDQAKKVKKQVQRLSHLFPKCVGRDRHYLLMEFIEGKVLTEQKLHKEEWSQKKCQDLYFQIGEIQGLAHKKKTSGSSDQLDAQFNQALYNLKKLDVFPTTDIQQLGQLYTEYRKEISFRFSLDIRDAPLVNYIIAPKRLYYIDEGGIGNLQGRGLSRLNTRLSRFLSTSKSIYWQCIKEGYETTQTNNWNPSYLKLVFLYDLVLRLNQHLDRHNKIDPVIKVSLQNSYLRAFKSKNKQKTAMHPKSRQASKCHFMIMFEGGTGSSFLVSCLNSHSDILCYPEIVSGITEPQQNEVISALIKGKPAEKVRQYKQLERFFPKSIHTKESLKSVGFKAKLYQIQNLKNFCSLIEAHRFKLIYMKRKNLIKSVLSRCNSERLKEKHGQANAVRPNMVQGAIHVDPIHFTQRLNARILLEQAHEIFFDAYNYEKQVIYYEDLLSDQERFFTKVSNFLQVKPITYKGKFYKNTPDDLKQAIKNYDQIYNLFKGTGFESYF